MGIACGECRRGEAVAIVEADEDGFVPVCRSCLDEFITLYGELALNHVYLTDLEEAVSWVVREANLRIRSFEKKVERLLEKGK